MPDGVGPSAGEAALVVLLAALTPLTLVVSALLERSGPIRLRHWSQRAGGALGRLYDARRRFEAFRLLAASLAYALPAALLVCLLRLGGGLFGRAALPLAAAGVGGLVLASEIVARRLVAAHSETTLQRLTPLFRLYRLLLAPLISLFAMVAPKPAAEGTEDEAMEEADDDMIEAYLKVGASEGILEPGEEALIQGVIDFGDTRVKSVMTPRIDMICAPAESSLEELAQLFLDTRHSRIPLYRESVDRIVGVLHIREVLRAQGAGVEPSALALPALFVPETKPLRRLLREFQTKRQQMAIVVDEYGGTAGLVTVEDLLEEIVGEIADEHEVTEEPAERQPDGSWRIEGWADLDVLEETFQVDLSAVPYETVGGLIFGLVGSVPRAGTTIESHGLRFTVESVEERRIQKVLVARPVAGEGGAVG